ncbi:SMI1 / KNR4 family (SUKH-1) [Planococcus glaciei]|uniref:SMI1/KNR4 family protein n=1 Tax=Planococcus glaciei TaxID=459472 RepID=UPI000882A709|nr:SMI1/KNR4 family protein [Planococcus glaciei]SDG82771.1 SMI1 / KNR4 family (SUKH-1) [Planococcus glaciei]
MKLWALEEDDNYKLPKVSRKKIKEIEKSLQKQLPDSYKKIVLKQNGGYLRYNAVTVQSSESERSTLDINHIYGLGEGGVLDSDYLIQEWNLPTNILIFSGDGNHFYALDYRTPSHTPAVIYLETDTEEIIRIAETFEKFLANLKIEEFFSDSNEEISIEEAERIFSGEDYLKMNETILNLIYTHQTEWYFKALLKLSSHKELLIRSTVLAVLDTNLKIYLVDYDKEFHPLLREITESLLADKDANIRNKAKELIREFE